MDSKMWWISRICHHRKIKTKPSEWVDLYLWDLLCWISAKSHLCCALMRDLAEIQFRDLIKIHPLPGFCLKIKLKWLLSLIYVHVLCRVPRAQYPCGTSWMSLAAVSSTLTPPVWRRLPSTTSHPRPPSPWCGLSSLWLVEVRHAQSYITFKAIVSDKEPVKVNPPPPPGI